MVRGAGGWCDPNHAWALTLTESRRVSGAAVLRHHDAVLGCLRADGFVLTELKLPFGPAEGADTFAAELNLLPRQLPQEV